MIHWIIFPARRHGAAALYISACSAEETIAFYLAMGCRLSPSPIPAMAQDEPWDIQLEYSLTAQNTDAAGTCASTAPEVE